MTCGGDQLVQVEGRQLPGNPDRGRGVIAGDRPAGTADEGIHAPPQVIGKHGSGGQRGVIGAHPSTITPTVIG